MATSFNTATAQLSPNYRLATIITLLGVPILFFQLWIGLFISVFGLFLIFQTSTIRLVFTSIALEVRRKETLLKTFPYDEWESWTIFWPSAPILFYFKEINSIHFLPMLFSPSELREALEQRVAALNSDLKNEL